MFSVFFALSVAMSMVVALACWDTMLKKTDGKMARLSMIVTMMKFGSVIVAIALVMGYLKYNLNNEIAGRLIDIVFFSGWAVWLIATRSDWRNRPWCTGIVSMTAIWVTLQVFYLGAALL